MATAPRDRTQSHVRNITVSGNVGTSGGPDVGAIATDVGVGALAVTNAPLVAPIALGAGLFGGIGDAISAPLDFLKMVAWIFYPRNILRAVEFLTGIAIMIFGFHAAIQARGESMEGFSTSESPLTRSGLGRVATELGRASRSGQRPSRPSSAPHATRRKALRQRYQREEDLQRRRASAPRPSK